MSEANLVGGTDADRKEILRLHEKYIDVNARFDWENLQPIFSGAPEATYFNLNGHTYKGREHWTRLWKFYVQNVQSGYWTPYDIGGTVTGDLARGVVPSRDAAAMDRHRNRRRATSTTTTRNSISRSTMVFRKEDGQWRVVHVHFSPGDSGPRPGGV